MHKKLQKLNAHELNNPHTLHSVIHWYVWKKIMVKKSAKSRRIFEKGENHKIMLLTQSLSLQSYYLFAIMKWQTDT